MLSCVISPVVPVYVFGEDKLYTTSNFCIGLRRWLVKVARIGIPIYWGRTESFGFLPKRQPLEAVCGAPLWPNGINEETQTDVWKQRLLATTPEKIRADKMASSAGKPVIPVGGAFLYGKRVRRDVRPEEVEEMHQRYVKAMGELFEKHKHKHPAYANASLEILSARG